MQSMLSFLTLALVSSAPFFNGSHLKGLSYYENASYPETMKACTRQSGRIGTLIS